MIINNPNIRILRIAALMICFMNCKAQQVQKKLPCKPESTYLSWIYEIGVDTANFKIEDFHCNMLSNSGDTIFVREQYFNNIYFEGNLIHGQRVGIWKGYYKGTKIVQTAYLGEKRDRPVYVELWSKRGKYIRKTYMSVIE